MVNFFLNGQIGPEAALAPIAVEILLRRGSAEKIATNSGKKLQKDSIKCN